MQQENQPIELEDILAEFKKLVDDYRENGVSKNTPFALKYGGNRGITRDPNTGALLESFPNKEDFAPHHKYHMISIPYCLSSRLF